MTEMLCLLPKPLMDIKCICFDRSECDIRIDDGGHLVCRHGSNESVIDGIVKIICPLEIASERKRWEDFINEELSQKALAE